MTPKLLIFLTISFLFCHVDGFPVKVTNLSPTSSKDDLWSIFMSTGDINSIAMNKDVAIIDYMDSEAAGKAVRRLNHVEFDGRTLTVANA
ncbi:hypothetical protein L5515_006580 [Caenorhabditis briggsae]|uniref:RRM domain-containing protein n=1 Tax=Caenorhabditis briggsae TaxID=6238 RepID=A0AAE9EWA9_CAEBR|nr:hypothetical protein L5515_006580 [Caenorhabditis briggsae]